MGSSGVSWILGFAVVPFLTLFWGRVPLPNIDYRKKLVPLFQPLYTGGPRISSSLWLASSHRLHEERLPLLQRIDGKCRENRRLLRQPDPRSGNDVNYLRGSKCDGNCPKDVFVLLVCLFLQKSCVLCYFGICCLYVCNNKESEQRPVFSNRTKQARAYFSASPKITSRN